MLSHPSYSVLCVRISVIEDSFQVAQSSRQRQSKCPLMASLGWQGDQQVTCYDVAKCDCMIELPVSYSTNLELCYTVCITYRKITLRDSVTLASK